MTRLRLTFVAAFAADLALIAYGASRLPERVPMHWNFHGEVDRYGSRSELLWFGPVVLLVLWAIAEALRFVDPKLSKRSDPEQTEAERFGTVGAAMGLAALLIVGIHATIFLLSLGILDEARRAHALLLGLFCLVFGNFVGKVRPNFFVGIRTPWTLSSDDVWRRTHRLAGRILVPAGLVAVVAALVLPAEVAFPVALTLMLAGLLIPAALSYVLWRRRPV